MMRKGLGKGMGTGYKNLAPMDSHIHALSAKGMNSKQSCTIKMNAKGTVNVPEWVTVNSTASDVFESTRWKLTHTHVGKNPYAVLDETLDDFIGKGYAEEKYKHKIIKQAKTYLGDFIKKYGQPPKTEGETLNAKSTDEEFVHKQESKYLPDFVGHKVWTEQQVNLVKRRLNEGKITVQEAFADEDNKLITTEQTKKGYDWLMDKWKSPTGKERVNNPFGGREQAVLEKFDHFELTDFYNQGQYGMKYYTPVWSVYDKEGNAFDYIMEGGMPKIVG